MKPPFKFSVPPADFADRFPDGDYTVGRGADPRSAVERAADAAHAAQHTLSEPTKKRTKRKPVTPREAAE
jgi:hypothetical protein